jgi:hypothetical protein
MALEQRFGGAKLAEDLVVRHAVDPMAIAAG